MRIIQEEIQNEDRQWLFWMISYNIEIQEQPNLNIIFSLFRPNIAFLHFSQSAK